MSYVTEDWRFRMVTPPKGDYTSMPLNAEGKRVADTWDWKKAAANYALVAKARRVEIVGYRGTAAFTNGERFIERQDIALRRARKLTEAFLQLGVPAATIVTRAVDATDGEGIASRRAVITVTPWSGVRSQESGVGRRGAGSRRQAAGSRGLGSHAQPTPRAGTIGTPRGAAQRPTVEL